MENYKFDNCSKTYFCVYNADSRPNKKTFESVSNVIYNLNFPKVIQQYSYAFSNLDNLSFMMKGFALYQSNFEIKNGLLNTLTFSNFLYTYVVGHGLFIRVDLLKELGGFDNKFWCEDIYLSSRLRNKNVKITPILNLESMETPKKLSILIKQNATWFKTANQCIKIFRANLENDNIISKSLIFWLFQRFNMNLKWLFYPLFLFLMFVFCFCFKEYILFLFLVCSYLFLQISNYYFTLKFIEKIENIKINNKFLLLCSSCISTLISNFGPIYSLFNVNMKKYKTER